MEMPNTTAVPVKPTEESVRISQLKCTQNKQFCICAFIMILRKYSQYCSSSQSNGFSARFFAKLIILLSDIIKLICIINTHNLIPALT